MHMFSIFFFVYIILIDNIGWFFSNTFCSLFKVNILTGDILKIIKLKGNIMIGGHCYSYIKKIRNKIVLLPINENTDVVTYDILTEKLNYINIGKVVFNIVITYKDSIILYDYQRLDKLMTINPDSGVKNIFYLKVQGLAENVGGIGHSVNAITWKNIPISMEWENSYCVYGNSIFVTDGRLVELNLEKKEVYFHNIYSNCKYIDICRIEDCFWILTNQGELIKWNIDKVIIKCIRLPYEGNHFLFSYRNELYIITEQLNDFYHYNSKQNRIDTIGSDSPLYEMVREVKDSNPFFTIINSNDGLFLQQMKSGKYYKVRNDDYHYQSYQLDNLEKFEKNLRAEIYGEYRWFCFDDFFNCIKILDSRRCINRYKNDWTIKNFL